MIASTSRNRAVLAVLGGVTCGLALVTVIASLAPRSVRLPRNGAIELPRHDARAHNGPSYRIDRLPPHDGNHCKDSVAQVRWCADRLYRDFRAEEAATLIREVIVPVNAYGQRVTKTTHSDDYFADAQELSHRASNYHLFASFWREGANTDPREAYWPLAVARTIDRELGGAHSDVIRARLIVVAPRAARMYRADAKHDPDARMNIAEPRAMAAELGVPID
jgi:hypothetical protein